jgi:PKD repeat protein
MKKTKFTFGTVLLLAFLLSGQSWSQCSASFTSASSPSGGVLFGSTGTSTAVISNYWWLFGDGTSGYGSSVTHMYNGNGTYTVTHGIGDSTTCSSTATAIISVTNAPCTANTVFNMVKDSVTALTWDAYPAYPFGVGSVTWVWGDGSTSNSMYPSHTYSAAGTYSICVIVTATCGATSTTCVNSAIYRSSESGAMITVRVLPKTGSTTGIQKYQDSFTEVQLWPNPVNDKFRLQINSTAVKQYKLELYDIKGKLIKTEHIAMDNGNSGTEIDTGFLEKGLYVLSLSDGANQKTLRLVKE